MASSSSTSLLPSEPLPWRPSTSPKLPPGALLDIADDLLWDLFTEWLPLEDVCRLDSALCQKRRRPYFLALLATKVLLFNREEVTVLADVSFHRGSHYTPRALGAEALNWILKRCINLASLHLSFHVQSRVEQQGIREAVASLALYGRLDKLETISLEHCYYIKDADLAAVLSKCYNSVKIIDIRGCGLTESAAVYIKRCTKLEAFASSGKESATDMMEIVQACRRLRMAKLGSFKERLTDEMVLSVADHCHLLERLELGYCRAVSDAAVRKVAESCPLLQYIHLAETNITDATVVSLCNNCPLLKQMFLGGCRKLTDAAVLAVAERLPGLTHIHLNVNSNITSSVMETLVSECRELENIDLSSYTNVSDATLSKIAEHCSNLRDLIVYRTPVTVVGLTEIATKCSKLELLLISKGQAESQLKNKFPDATWKLYVV